MPVIKNCLCREDLCTSSGLLTWTLTPEGQSRGHLGASAGAWGQAWWLMFARSYCVPGSALSPVLALPRLTPLLP